MLPELHTRRLALRPATPADVDTLWALWTHPDVRRFLWDDATIPRARAAETVAACQAHAADGLGLWLLLRWGEGGAQEDCVGCAGLLRVDAAGQFLPALAGGIEPLIALAPTAWHQGYATEALRRVLDHAFRTLGLPELVAAVDVPNEASRRVVERLGFAAIGDAQGPRYVLRGYRLPRADGVSGVPNESGA